MEKLLIILLIAGIPANIFILFAKFTGKAIALLLFKSSAFIYCIFAIIIVLKYYNLI